MFYIVLFVFGYISLGLGVWIAMRHKEILRHQQRQEYGSKNQSDEFMMMSYQMSQEEKRDGWNESAEGNSDASLEMANEQMRLDSATLLASESQADGEMIEQLVGMVEENESDELTAIVQQLQEIHNLISEADMRCYVSEDAECFITPDEEQYATTAICRPKVGCKKAGQFLRS